MHGSYIELDFRVMKPPGIERERRERLALIAAGQAGFFTARQAASVGYSSRLQHHHAAKGNWRRIERGIYRLPAMLGGGHEGLIRAALWSGGRGVISHDSALAFYDLSDVMPEVVHLTVPRTFRKRRDGFVLHRADLAPESIRKEQGFLVTTPAQTLADVANSDLAQEHLNAAVADALRLGLVRTKGLVDSVLDLPNAAAVRLRKSIRALEAAK